MVTYTAAGPAEKNPLHHPANASEKGNFTCHWNGTGRASAEDHMRGPGSLYCLHFLHECPQMWSPCEACEGLPSYCQEVNCGCHNVKEQRVCLGHLADAVGCLLFSFSSYLTKPRFQVVLILSRNSFNGESYVFLKKKAPDVVFVSMLACHCDSMSKIWLWTGLFSKFQPKNLSKQEMVLFYVADGIGRLEGK